MLDPILHTYAVILKHLGQSREAGELEGIAEELRRRIARDSGAAYTVDVRRLPLGLYRLRSTVFGALGQLNRFIVE
jgi:hypothetical protein